MANAARRAAASVCACSRIRTTSASSFGEFEGQYTAPWMQNQIESGGQQLNMAAQHFTHAALDAIAIVSLAQHFAGGKPDARVPAYRLCTGARLRAPETSSSTQIAACAPLHRRAGNRRACAAERPPAIGGGAPEAVLLLPGAARAALALGMEFIGKLDPDHSAEDCRPSRYSHCGWVPHVSRLRPGRPRISWRQSAADETG